MDTLSAEVRLNRARVCVELAIELLQAGNVEEVQKMLQTLHLRLAPDPMAAHHARIWRTRNKSAARLRW